MEDQKFCLRWESFQSSITSVFDHLRQDEELVDITLCCEGQKVKAHRMMLSACSPYFREILNENRCQQMVLFLRDTPAADLRAVVEFMYRGVVNVSQSQLGSFIKTAEALQIRGLSGDDDKSEQGRVPPAAACRPDRVASSGSSSGAPPAAKRWRGSPGPEVGRSPGTPSPADSGAASPAAAAVKLEPAEDGDVTPDVTLDTTLGYVAAFEGGGGGGSEVIGLDGQTAAGDAARYGGGVSDSEAAPACQPNRVPVPASPGPGRSPNNGAAATGGSSNQHPCDICGKVYKYRISLLAHRKHHEGRTACFVCGHTSSTVQNLRQHLRFVHRLGSDEVSRRTGLKRVRLTAADTVPHRRDMSLASTRWPGTAVGLRQPGTPPPHGLARAQALQGHGGGAQALQGHGGGAQALQGQGGGAQALQGHGGGAQALQGQGGGAQGLQGQSGGAHGLRGQGGGAQGQSVGAQGLQAPSGRAQALQGQGGGAHLLQGQGGGADGLQGQSVSAQGPACPAAVTAAPAVDSRPVPAPSPAAAAAVAGPTAGHEGQGGADGATH